MISDGCPGSGRGFDLGLQIEKAARDNPHYKGVVLGGHGLFTWADDARECYELTLAIIQKAQDWLDANIQKPVFGGVSVSSLDPTERRAKAFEIMPSIRGMIGHGSAQDRSFRRQRCGAGICRIQASQGTFSARYLMP